MVVDSVETITDGVTDDVTWTVSAFEVTLCGFAQPIDEVICTVTTSLFDQEEFWYVALLDPTLVPFNFH
jgi:hypothetical protein